MALHMVQCRPPRIFTCNSKSTDRNTMLTGAFHCCAAKQPATLLLITTLYGFWGLTLLADGQCALHR